MTRKIRSDLKVDAEFGERLDDLAAICDRLVEACHEMASGSANVPDPASQIATEAAGFRAAYPNAPTNIEYAPAQAATSYVELIRLQLASIAALLRAREVAGTLWPLVRAELESAGRVAWLLEPTVEQPAAIVRVARFYLEAISSLQRARFTTGKYDRAAEKRLKAERNANIEAAKFVFPDISLDFEKPDSIGGWTIYGQPMLGLGAAANLFAGLSMTGPGRALYDILSDYSHPSLVSIEQQTRLIDDGQVASRPWVATWDEVEHQTRWACTILYKACHLIGAYLELDAGPLERWADSVPKTWFTEGAAE